MASFTLTNTQVFPNGTSVSAYAVSNWPAHVFPSQTEAAPIGSATNTQTMTSGTLTFTGLTAGVDYVAYAQVGGQHRYIRFTAAADSASTALVAHKNADESITGAWTFSGNATLAGLAVLQNNVYVDANGVGAKLNFGSLADATLGRAQAHSLGVDAGAAATKKAVVGGCLFQHFADAGNTTTGETDLFSDSIPGAVLTNNGDEIDARYAGITVAHATNTRRIRVYFAGTVIYDSTALATVAAANWDLAVRVIRVSATVVRCSVAMRQSSAAAFPAAQYTEITGLTLTNAQILKITGQSSSATNDIVAKLSDANLLPAAV